MVLNLKKLLKSFKKLPLLCKIVGVVVICLIIKLIGDCLTRKLEGMGNPKELIYFYMDGCSHCEKFSPIWDQFVNQYNGPLQLKKMERKQAGEELLKKYNVNGFPMVILVDEEGNSKPFEGKRTVEELNIFTN
tara:strand:+ start:2212 stop:2610 length:399 start_codon:yes stop_codon:yes gene_type:complete